MSVEHYCCMPVNTELWILSSTLSPDWCQPLLGGCSGHLYKQLSVLICTCRFFNVHCCTHYSLSLYSATGNRDRNPVYYAAMAGKHEIVEYLLSITGVSPDSETV